MGGDADEPSAPMPLSRREIEKVRELLESERRYRWLWGSIRVIATWVAAVVVGVTMAWDALKRIVLSMKT